MTFVAIRRDPWVQLPIPQVVTAQVQVTFKFKSRHIHGQVTSKYKSQTLYGGSVRCRG